MFGVAAVSGCYERRAVRRLSTWTREYRREVAAVGLGCAALGVFMATVKAFDADTVAVLASPKMNGIRLRSLAREFEKPGSDLCVSPALLDVAGPRVISVLVTGREPISGASGRDTSRWYLRPCELT
jgi:hypothetical protein